MPNKKVLLKKIVILMAGMLAVGYILYTQTYKSVKFKGYYTIGVILDYSDMTPNDVEILTNIVKQRTQLINKQGGVNERELRAIYLDDKGSPEEAKKVVAETINDPHMIGYVGSWNSTRSKAISEIVAPARMPFIGGYALTHLFEDYPTMFTVEKGIEDVAARFNLLLEGKYKRPAFIGRADDLYSRAFLDQLYNYQASDSSVRVVMANWYPIRHAFTQEDMDTIITGLKSSDADFLILSFGSSNTAAITIQLRKAGIHIPVFTALGDLGHVIGQAGTEDIGELYDLNVVGIPGTFNLRLQEKVPSFVEVVTPGKALEFQLSFSARIADSIGLLAEAAKIGRYKGKEKNIRERINSGMQQYIGGGRVYRGWFGDWYFNAERAAAGDVLLAWKPELLPRHILAPNQFSLINDTLKQVPVYFTHLDMVQLNQISDIEGSFYASFYFEITSTDTVDIQQIDFTNAARSETSHELLLDVKPISFKRKLENDRVFYNYMFKVTGKFLFEPDLKNYPFDTQKFAIKFQPENATKPFIVQPSTSSLDDSTFFADGWRYLSQYVGYDHDIISYLNSFNDKQIYLPFYKFSYTYVMARAKADFFLKVLTPLLVILVVTYFSVFIPMHRFETLEAIQVTSLLASIALNFSVYKPAMEYATISDKIFIFTYIMITSLIGTSILQFVKRKKYKTESTVARIYQYYIYPAIILVVTLLLI